MVIGDLWEPPEPEIFVKYTKHWYGWKVVITDSSVVRRRPVVYRSRSFEGLKNRVENEIGRRWG